MFIYGLNSRASSSSANPNPVCIICNELNATENFHAAEVFYASKSKLNAEHITKLTSNSRYIAVYIGNNAFAFVNWRTW